MKKWNPAATEVVYCEDCEDYTLPKANMLQDCLQKTANQMLALAERMSETGESLTSSEKNLCRIALLEKIDDIMAEAKMGFLAGRHSDYVNDSLYEFTQLVKQFNN